LDALWLILTQFIFRVTLGTALAMAFTPARLVTSGFYRVHLWVLMGLNTFAALAAFSARNDPGGYWLLGLVIATATVCYFAAVVWLYEQRAIGVVLLLIVAGLSLACGGLGMTEQLSTASPTSAILLWGDLATSGLLMGAVLTAMFLGHWYLNTPTMQLGPLRRLIVLILVALVLRAVFSFTGWVLTPSDTLNLAWRSFLTLRWLAGIVGVLLLAVMTWQTLKIPNTQSATGILYAAVIIVFIGELTSQLLSVESPFPV